MGIGGGYIIGSITDFYTASNFPPVKNMAKSCTSGPAINVIYGLAVGYNSTFVPILMIAIIIVVNMSLLGFLGISFAAIGILSTLCVELSIDAYGPICDNAGGISEMSELGETVRTRTDALDAAGNTTAAVGKGFAIASAALVAFSLIGAFVRRGLITEDNPLIDITIINHWLFAGLIYGAMLPYIFSAFTMKSVGSAAKKMVAEVRRQFKNEAVRNGTEEPDYERCIKVST